MSGEFSLDKTFWDQFIRTLWHRKPAVLRSPFPRPIVSPAETFRAALAAVARLRVPTDDVVLFVGQHRMILHDEIRRCLPRSTDSSFSRYLSRLHAFQPGRQIALSVNNFQRDLSWEVFGRIREFLENLYRAVGIPALRAEIGLFAGNYLRTGAGVHRDSADVFCFAVEGCKRVRVWPAHAFAAASPVTGPRSYSHLLRRSTLLEGLPGDILYWPSSYWHIAESDGRPGISLSLALHYRGSLLDALTDTLDFRSRDVLGQDPPFEALPFSASILPATLKRAAGRTQRLARPLSMALFRHGMERSTAYGFAWLPKLPSGRAPVRVNVVTSGPSVSIRYARIDRRLLVAANGRSVFVPMDRQAMSFLHTVSRGGSFTFNHRATRANRSPTPLQRVIRFLWSVSALRPV